MVVDICVDVAVVDLCDRRNLHKCINVLMVVDNKKETPVWAYSVNLLTSALISVLNLQVQAKMRAMLSIFDFMCSSL